MSLVNQQTSSLLGIGEGSVQDFAAGISRRRKVSKGLSREEALQKATAAEGQDQRMIDAGDLQPQHDPKKTQGAQLQLDVNDRAFIEKLRYVERKIFKGDNELGKNATKKLKGQVEGLLEAASKSSRGGLAPVWGEVYDRIKDQGGRTAPGGLSKLQDAWGRAMEATNKVLDTSVDLKTYQFNKAGKIKGGFGDDPRISGSKQEKRVAQQYSKGGYDAPTNFWENPAYKLDRSLMIGPKNMKDDYKKQRRAKRLSIRQQARAEGLDPNAILERLQINR